MAGRGISDDQQPSSSRNHHWNVNAASYKNKSVTMSAHIVDENDYSELSSHWIPNPNAVTLQRKMQVLRGNGPSNRDASQLPENRICLEQNNPRDCIPSGGGLGDKNYEEEISSGLCRRTYLTDSILNLEDGQSNGGNKSLCKGNKQDLSRRMVEAVTLENSPTVNGKNPAQKGNSKDWSPQKRSWKKLVIENIEPIGSAERLDDETLSEETFNINDSGVCRSHYISDSGPRTLSENLPKVNTLDGSALRTAEWSVENTNKLAHLSGLWRTDSWESVGSNASLFFLSEKVELKHTNLKRMLSSSHRQHKPGIGIGSHPQESLAQSSSQFQPHSMADSFSRNKYIKQGCRISENVSDWDSRILLQNSNGGLREFESFNQLPLSPRHKLAKQLLERGRMKARACALKAVHSILPEEKHLVRKIGTRDIPSPRKGYTFQEDCSLNTLNCCNLSDSSSGELCCGLCKKRSQSPSHIMFDDEFTQQAEVCSQLHKKCGLESSVQRFPIGLIQKHGFPHCGIPEKETVSRAQTGNCGKSFHRDTDVIGSRSWKSGENPITTRETGGNPFGKDSGHLFNIAICIDGKCSCCGSYIISDTKVICPDPPSYEFPAASILQQDREPQRPNHHELPMSTAMKFQANLGAKASNVGVSPPRIVPCCVLPSQHQIRIEPIKETYIGEITTIDDVLVTESNTPDTTFQKMKDRREPKNPTQCSDTMPEKSRSSTNCTELNTKGSKVSTGCTGGNTFNTGPVCIVTDRRSRCRRKTIEKPQDSLQHVHCQISSIQESRDSVDSEIGTNVSVSKHNHVQRPHTEQLVDASSFSMQPLTSSCPVVKLVQSSKENIKNSTLYCSLLSQQKGTISLRNSQFKDTHSSSYSQSRSRKSNSHSLNALFPKKCEKNTSDQNHLPRRPVINKANLTILSKSQQNKLPQTQDNKSLTNLYTCPSPHYRVIHLNPEENARKPFNSQYFPETSSLQHHQSPSGPDQQFKNSQTSGVTVLLEKPPLNSTVQLLRSDSKSSKGHRSEVWKNSEMPKEVTDIHDGRLSSEHKMSIKFTKVQNCLTDPSHATIPSSKQSTEKKDSIAATVKILPQDVTSSGEPMPPAPLPKSLQRAEKDDEPLLPGTGTAHSTDMPMPNPASKSSDNQQLFTSQGTSRILHITNSQHVSQSLMKAFFASVGHNTVSKLNSLQSYSMEQMNWQSTEDKSGEL